MRCFHRTTLNPRGIELEKPDQCFIVETANQIISKVKSFIQNFDVFDYVDMFGIQLSGTFEMPVGGTLTGGIIYIEDNFLHLLGSVEGGITTKPDVGLALSLVWGDHVDSSRTATPQDIEGKSISFSIDFLKIRGVQIGYGQSLNFDEETKKIGKIMIIHSLTFSIKSSKLFTLALNPNAVQEVKKKFLKKSLGAGTISGQTFLWKIPIEITHEQDTTKK